MVIKAGSACVQTWKGNKRPLHIIENPLKKRLETVMPRVKPGARAYNKQDEDVQDE